MQKTWLETFHEQTNLNQYPIALRTRGGIGYKMPGGETISTFVGHPVHYFENGLWKPITLQPHANGDFEGSDFSWRGKQVFYKGKTLFEPRAVIFNGVRHNLFLRQDGNRIVADLNFEGSTAQYEVIFSEKGVKELLTIFEAVEGLIEFNVPHANKPDGLYKKDRHIIGGITAETFQLTADMKYPLEIDPNYSADAADDTAFGANPVYATARSTSTGVRSVSSGEIHCGQWITGGEYFCERPGIKFVTSGIPDGDSVSDAVVKLVCTADVSTSADFNVNIQKHDWSSQEPIASNREAFYDGVLAASIDVVWRNTSGMSINTQYTSPSLDTSRISKTGNTYYSLISSRDVSATAPGGDEYIRLASQDNATSGYRPILTVTHTASGGSTRNRLALLGVS